MIRESYDTNVNDEAVGFTSKDLNVMIGISYFR